MQLIVTLKAGKEHFSYLVLSLQISQMHLTDLDFLALLL